MNKLAYLFAFATLFNVKVLVGQTKPDSTMVEKYLLDFSVPDMPAFKALGTDPSNILRPNDAKKFAAMVSPFYSNGQGVIPKNYALEVAPWKLASKNWKLSDYTSDGLKRFLYRSSFSLGTLNDSTKFPSKLSVGYRVSILSTRADIIRMGWVRNKMDSIAQTLTEYTQLTNDWVIYVKKVDPADRPSYYQNHISEFLQFLSTIKDYIKKNPNKLLSDEITNIDKDYKNLVSKMPGSIGAQNFTSKDWENFFQVVSGKIEDFIADYSAKNWNASRLDLAMAWVGQSKNDLISSSQFALFSVWSTWAIRAHDGGQLLFGGNFSLPRSENKDSTKVNWNINLRYYLGTQDFRGFLETQYKFKKFDPNGKSLLINLGAEFRLGSNFWVIASAGLNNYLNETKPFNKLISNIDLRYSFNKPR